MNAVATEVINDPIRIDLGAGKNKRQGFLGVDIKAFDGVDIVADLTKPWQWEDNSVAEIHASHFVEHLDAQERIHFANEAYRVLIPDGKLTIICPHYSSERAYGDLTHKWPPVTGFWFCYLNKDWRAVNAPHNDFYACHFEGGWGANLHPALAGRNQEYVQYATQWYREACQDVTTTLTAKK